VAALGRAQDAWTRKGAGYEGFLYPYDRVSFDRLFKAPFRNCDPVCVPFYVMHKMMAGLLDQYSRAGNSQAFKMVTAMASWVKPEVEAILARPNGEAQWQSVLNTEWGGMNEVLYNLYAITGDSNHLVLGKYFNHYQWTAPLAIGQDDLDASHGNTGGNHANTHIPEIIGSARGYELTGNSTQNKIASNFFSIVTTAHTFATGGSNDHEHWGKPHRMGYQLDSDTEESCTTYNILKVARHLYEWSADAGLADFFERALLNGMMGNQNRLNPNMTRFIYMLPLGGVVRKPWSDSNRGFPCCWGTLSEQFSKLGDSIMFRSPENDVLYVNFFASASLDWPERGYTVSLDAGAFPASMTSTGTIKIEHVSRRDNEAWTLMVRVPYWALSGRNAATLNGRILPVSTPGSYLKVGPRVWVVGDIVSFHFPMTLHFEQLDDTRTEWKGVGSILYGPLMLAAVGPHVSDRLAIENVSNLNAYIQRNSTDKLSFTVPGRALCADGPQELVPFNTVVEEEYAVYFHTKPNKVPVIDAGSPSITTEPSAWSMSGSSKTVPSSAGYDIRTGNPHQTGLAELDSPIMDKAHYITGFKFGYSYVSGYGRDPSTSGRGANFSLILGSCRDLSSAATLLYASPELVDYPYDKCRAWPSCYSPEVSAEVKDLKVATSQPLRLALKFQNNDRNLQIHLPLNVSLSWSNGAVTKISVGHRVKPHDYPVEAVEPWGNNDDGVIGDRTIFL